MRHPTHVRSFYRSRMFTHDSTRRRLLLPALLTTVLAIGALSIRPPDDLASPSPPEPLVPAASHSPMPSSCGNANGCKEELTAPAGWKFTVFRNFPMAGSSAVTRAVIVVHGTGRNADGYFASVMAAAAKSGVTKDTLVIAPWFKTSEDSPSSGEATWTSAAWKIGDGAQSPRGLSSFLVMDQIIATLASKQRFPNLRTVTLTGHSAGGQFTQRYAAFGLAPNALPGVTVRYVPANPSSYVYFNSTRPGGSGGSCADFDKYKYGMSGRDGYPGKLSPNQVLANYSNRDVTIVNGGADTFDNGDMDSDCGAMLQGPNRATRGANFVQYIHKLAPGTAARQSRIVVNGVDHNGDAIYADPAVRNALFGTGESSSSSTQASLTSDHDQ